VEPPASGGRNIERVWGNVGIKAGDVAINPAANHHFLITGIDASAKKYITLEGNTRGQEKRLFADGAGQSPLPWWPCGS
jgi:hypothetical protein